MGVGVGMSILSGKVRPLTACVYASSGWVCILDGKAGPLPCPPEEVLAGKRSCASLLSCACGFSTGAPLQQETHEMQLAPSALRGCAPRPMLSMHILICTHILPGSMHSVASPIPARPYPPHAHTPAPHVLSQLIHPRTPASGRYCCCWHSRC